MCEEKGPEKRQQIQCILEALLSGDRRMEPLERQLSPHLRLLTDNSSL